MLMICYDQDMGNCTLFVFIIIVHIKKSFTIFSSGAVMVKNSRYIWVRVIVGD